VYKLFSENPFALAITFHAGEHSITHPWGAGNHLVDRKSGERLPDEHGYNEEAASSESPDEISFEKVVNVLKNTASFSTTKDLPVYITGPISSVVYAVEGGMEDWGYAAGWENKAYDDEDADYHKDSKGKMEYPIVEKCRPKTYGDKEFISDSTKD